MAVILGLSVSTLNSDTRKVSSINERSSAIIFSLIWILPVGKHIDQLLAFGGHGALVDGAGAHVEIEHGVVGGEHDRIGGAVALLEEGGFLGIQGLQCGQHDLGGAAAVDFAGGLIVAGGCERKHPIAAFRRHQAIAFDRDVVGAERHAFDAVGSRVVVLARFYAVEEVIEPLAILLERRHQVGRQALRVPHFCTA